MHALKKTESSGQGITSVTHRQDLSAGREPAFFIGTSISFLIIIFLFFNSFPRTTAIKEIVFYLSLFIALVGIAWHKIDFSFKTPLSWPLLFFTGWCLATLPFALNLQNSIHDIYAHLIKYITLYFLIVNFFNTERKLIYLIWTIVISAALFSLFAMVHFYFVSGNNLSIRLDPYWEIPCNIIGTITVCSIIIALSLLKKTRNVLYRGTLVFCSILSGVATIMTQTRGAFLALFVSLIILFPCNKKIIGATVLVFGLIFLILPTKNGILERVRFNMVCGNERIPIIYCFSEMVKDHPITGIGFGLSTYLNDSLIDQYNNRVPKKFKQAIPVKAPHNFILDTAVRTGLIGLVFFMSIIVITFRMSWKILRYAKGDNLKSWALCTTASLMALLIQGLFENTMSGPPAILLYTLFAMITILWSIDRRLQQNIALKTAEAP
jgi:putative inorganic carbon (HCO3(-)) transporter